MARAAEPPLPQVIHTQKGLEHKGSAQITTCTNRTIVQLVVHPISRRSDSDISANMLSLV